MIFKVFGMMRPGIEQRLKKKNTHTLVFFLRSIAGLLP